jgi:MYXO-CTERM domain-containing protein
MKITYLATNRLSLLLLASFMLTLGVERAFAQDCLSDDDCAADEHCELLPVATSCFISTDSDAAPVCTTEEQELGTCEAGPGSCSQDADCGEGYICKIGREYANSDMPCSADGSCPEPQPVEETGECKPVPIACETDNDCPSPTTCQSDTDNICTLKDGKSVCTEQEVRRCFYKLVTCGSDDDCDAGYECAVVGTSSECKSSGPSAAPAPCPEGEVCDADAGSAQQSEDAGCETIQEQTCFPKRVDCKTDSDCDNGWKCLDFSETLAMRDDYKDGEYAGPPWWQQGDETKAVACMPEGLIAFFNGHINSESSEGGNSSVSGSDKEESASGQAGVAGSQGIAKGVQTDSGVDDASQGESSKNNSGGCNCSMSRKPTSSAYGLAFVALFLTFWLRRRGQR